MRAAIFLTLFVLLAVESPSPRAAEEAAAEADLSRVHKLAVLPAMIKLETARRPRRGEAVGPQILRRDARERSPEELADEEKLAVARMAGELFRQTFASLLRTTGYQLMDLSDVERRVSPPAPGADLDLLAAGRAVGADAVLATTVLKAANELGGIYSETTLKVIVSLVVVSTGQVAWEVEEQESIKSGVLPGGTQVVEIVGSFNTSEAQRERDLRRVVMGLARKLVLTLPDPHRNLDVPVYPPQIFSATVVVGGARVQTGQALAVEMTGEAGQRASFDLARPDGQPVYSDLPMSEKHPGHYGGLYRPIAEDPARGPIVVRVRLAGESGIASRRWVGTEEQAEVLEILEASPGERPAGRAYRSTGSRGPSLDYVEGWQPCQPRFLAILPFAHPAGKQEGALVLRQTLFGSLFSSQFRLIDNLAVERAMKRLGVPLSGRYSESQVRAVGQALGADLVLTGEVTRWDRTYMAVQSTISTGLKVSLLDAATGARVAGVEDKISRSKGLAGIPTGIGAAVLAPISGMSKRFLYRSAFDLTESVAGALSCLPPGGESSGGAIKSLNYEGPDSHSLLPGDIVEVRMEASAGGHAYFSVGDVWSFLPMREITPGKYHGVYQIRVGDYLAGDQIRAVLVGEGWKRSTKTLESTVLSTATASQ